ncbi:DNA-binding protein [Escherichia coli]|nr:DNA-binding protein [Escherichia coli]EHW5263105.1 DNA-binding protein [Escherichia coli]EJN6680051.1 DNA-binding protein [Escherichia coli]
MGQIGGKLCNYDNRAFNMAICSSFMSSRAIYKWMDNGKLPRTEYTGETNYAEKIALASNGLFSADAILTIGRNKTTTKKLMGVDS